MTKQCLNEDYAYELRNYRLITTELQVMKTAGLSIYNWGETTERDERTNRVFHRVRIEGSQESLPWVQFILNRYVGVGGGSDGYKNGAYEHYLGSSPIR